ncbi:hypothetical protein D3C76_896000 [compost metagenome]
MFSQGCRQIDHRLFDVGSRQGYHTLTGTDHLARLGMPERDDSGMVIAQLNVAELISGLPDSRLGLLHRCLGSAQIGPCRIQLCLCANASIKQLLLAPRIGPGIDQLGLDLGQVTLGRAQLVLLVDGVKGRQQCALVDLGTDIDITLGNTPGNAKAEDAFVARLDTPGKTPQLLLTLLLGRHVQHRPYRLGRRLFLGTTCEHKAAQCKHRYMPHGANPSLLSLAISICIPGCNNCPPATTTFSPSLRPSLRMTRPVR